MPKKRGGTLRTIPGLGSRVEKTVGNPGQEEGRKVWTLGWRMWFQLLFKTGGGKVPGVGEGTGP